MQLVCRRLRLSANVQHAGAHLDGHRHDLKKTVKSVFGRNAVGNVVLAAHQHKPPWRAKRV
jgi:hypothetical protein